MTRQTFFSLAIAVAMVGGAGCQIPTGLLTQAGAQQASQFKGVVITGSVLAPAGIIAPGGGNIIAPGGGNYRALALTEAPLADSEVYLADAAGEPIPGIDPVKTDKDGKYKFKDIPAGHTFVVAAKAKTADGKDAVFQTIAKSEELGATAHVSASSTMVAAAVLEGQGGQLGDFNPSTFKTALETTKKNLKDGDLPDFSDRAAIVAKMNALVEAVAELKSALAEIKKDLAEISDKLDSIEEALKKREGGMAPPPGGQQPPPGGQQPPPGGQQPPPGGQQPPPGGQQPGNRVEFTFFIAGEIPADHHPVKVEFKAPDGNVVGVAEFAQPGAKAKAMLPPGLGHTLWVRTTKAPAGANKGWFVNPPDNAKEVPLPLPEGTGQQQGGTQPPPDGTQPPPDGTQPPPDGQNPPPGEMTLVEHKFVLPEGRFAAGDYPIEVAIRVPKSTQTVAMFKFEATGATAMGKIPHDLPHEVWFRSQTQTSFKMTKPDWVVNGGTDPLILPL